MLFERIGQSANSITSSSESKFAVTPPQFQRNIAKKFIRTPKTDQKILQCPNPKLYQHNFLEAGTNRGEFGVARVFDGIYVIDKFAAKVSDFSKFDHESTRTTQCFCKTKSHKSSLSTALPRCNKLVKPSNLQE